jgi:glycosyltransferase involved in cell wall biosynthesis
MKHLTLIIPAKKEKESLPNVLKEIEDLDCKKNVILEKNDTETIESIKNYNCQIIYQNGKGYGNALIQGIKNCETELFAIFNADGSFNPRELNLMIKLIKNEKLDFVFGSRYQEDGSSEDDTIVTLIGNYFFSLLGKALFQLNITDILYTFVMGRTDKCKELELTSNDFTFCVELPIKIKKFNFKMKSIASFERKRISGKKKVNALLDGFKILIKMLKLF